MYSGGRRKGIWASNCQNKMNIAKYFSGVVLCLKEAVCWAHVLCPVYMAYYLLLLLDSAGTNSLIALNPPPLSFSDLEVCICHGKGFNNKENITYSRSILQNLKDLLQGLDYRYSVVAARDQWVHEKHGRAFLVLVLLWKCFMFDTGKALPSLWMCSLRGWTHFEFKKFFVALK